MLARRVVTFAIFGIIFGEVHVESSISAVGHFSALENELRQLEPEFVLIQDPPDSFIDHFVDVCLIESPRRLGGHSEFRIQEREDLHFETRRWRFRVETITDNTVQEIVTCAQTGRFDFVVPNRVTVHQGRRGQEEAKTLHVPDSHCLISFD